MGDAIGTRVNIHRHHAPNIAFSRNRTPIGHHAELLKDLSDHTWLTIGLADRDMSSRLNFQKIERYPVVKVTRNDGISNITIAIGKPHGDEENQHDAPHE